MSVQLASVTVHDMVQSMDSYSKQHKLGLNELDTMRHIMRAQLARCDGTRMCPPRNVQLEEGALFFDSGPFWQRVFASWADPRNAEWACKQLDQVLAVAGAKRAVAGHTIQVCASHATGGNDMNASVLIALLALHLASVCVICTGFCCCERIEMLAACALDSTSLAP